ncbi:MAG: Asp-tRNA(Asn)/Glu-tRNA(Gln) amidotransferase subunit GatA [Peptococcaceae bacterium]|jgi:aspartyl-tRNA(Asn)/glutamyl-tRNA(Gln) amidotransferase subunit A|nr:Asp-tRNA(Asn)/Glu-tRNA(Gln) amidotransferase subunit GatA [Peptococcaceae bacterium]
MPAHALKQLYLSREASVPEVVTGMFAHIKQTEPAVDAYLTLCEESAAAQAQAIQKRYDQGEDPGLLAGVPMAVKDNLCTRNIRTTCASRMLENFTPPYNAAAVEKILAEGAILLGKTNMDEFAMGSSTEYSYFKKTRNPWNPQRVPGGSSGGSAAAVAARTAVCALGSDTGGSVRQPASFCGVVGVKPTYGRFSRYGLIAYASSLDQVGVLSQDVEDCALLTKVLSGYDPRDTTSADEKTDDYLAGLNQSVRGLTLGIPKEYYREGIHPDVRKAVEDAIGQFQTLGAAVKEVSLPHTEDCLPVYYIIACAEASSNLGRYDGVQYGRRASGYRDLSDMILKSRSEGFGPEVQRRILLGTYVLSAGYYDAYYKKAQQVRTLLKQDFDEALSQCDCLLTPVSPVTAFAFGEKSGNPVEMYLTDIFTVSVNIAGLPALVVPGGQDASGMPCGIQLVGKPFGEAVLFKIAHAFEQSTPWHSLTPKEVAL